MRETRTRLLQHLGSDAFGGGHLARRSDPSLRLQQTQPARFQLVPKVSALSQTALVRRPGTVPVLRPGVDFKTRPLTSVAQLSKRQRFPVASIDLSRADIGLPYGVPRLVNAATLKRIAGGQKSDRLLKKTSAGWQFVPDDSMIDVTDNSVEFKLGRLTIFS